MTMDSYNNFARVYDALTQNVDYAARAAYYDQMITRFGGNKGILLDFACGTGSMSMEFARMGYDVIGVDGSEEMLSAAMDKKFESGLSTIIYLCQQMQRLDLYGTIDAAVCALDSLNHITNEADLREAIRRVSLFTNPGGLFLFDMNTIYKHEQVLANNVFFYDEPEATCIWQNTLKSDHVVDIDLDLFIHETGNRYLRAGEHFSERAYSDSLLQSILAEAGFELLAVFDEDSEEKPRPDSERLVYIARKA